MFAWTSGGCVDLRERARCWRPPEHWSAAHIHQIQARKKDGKIDR